MRHTTDRYAAAFLAAIDEAPAGQHARIVRRFVQAVAKHGDLSRANDIVAAIERRLVKSRGGRWVRVTFARPASNEIVARFRKRFPAPDHVETAVDPSLIAGARVTVDGEEELDMSFARKLNRLFSGSR
ncbi:hypothetical protein C4552_03720 [Candidatus Parcubacteria bacterium]|nr:MAG: hypothetical protein C4552_03720 [Candidatus Parcubacteria bacterium]